VNAEPVDTYDILVNYYFDNILVEQRDGPQDFHFHSRIIRENVREKKISN